MATRTTSCLARHLTFTTPAGPSESDGARWVISRASVATSFSLGYEFHRDKWRTDVTAGDDPDCLCGYWWLSIAPMNISTLEETQPPLELDEVERSRFFKQQVHAFYWQDQSTYCSREGQHRRTIRRLYIQAGPDRGDAVGTEAREQSAYSYRQESCTPRDDHSLFWHRNSFTPQRTIPEDGTELEPSTAATTSRSSLAGMEQTVGHEPRCLLRQSKQSSGPRIPDLLCPGRGAERAGIGCGCEHGLDMRTT